MALTPEQIAEMDAIAGGGGRALKKQLPADMPDMEVMDQIAGIEKLRSPTAAIPKEAAKNSALSLQGKSLMDLTPDERAAIRDGVSGQAGSFIVGNADSRSLGFGDEMMAGLTAIPGWVGSQIAGTDKSLGQVYDERLAKNREGAKEVQERNPGAYMAGQIYGGIRGAQQFAGTAASQAVGNSLRTGEVFGRNAGLAGRALKSGAVAAPISAAYGFASGEGSADNRIDEAGDGLVSGFGAGVALPVAGAAAVAGLRRLNTRTIVPGADQIRDAADQFYKKADELGGMLKPEFTNKLIAAAEKIRPQSEQGRAFAGNNEITQAVNDFTRLRGQPISLQAAHEIDKNLTGRISSLYRAGNNEQGSALSELQDTFRDMIENASDGFIAGGREGFQAVKEGRKLWGVSKRMEAIEDVLKHADTYQVPATAIKTGMRNLWKSKRIAGYSPEEVKAIKHAANTGLVTDVFSVFGSRLGPLAAGASGMATMGPVGGAAAALASFAGSSVSRNIATTLQKGRANKALREVANRSGMVRSEQRLALPEIDPIAFITGSRANMPAVASKELPRQQLALPAPASDLISDGAGGLRPQTAAERDASILSRQQATELGSTPDVRGAVDKMLKGRTWDAIEENQKARITSEIEEAWRNKPSVSLTDIIEDVLSNSDQLADEIGDSKPITQMSEALRNAKVKQIMKLPPAQARKLLQKKPK